MNTPNFYVQIHLFFIRGIKDDFISKFVKNEIMMAAYPD